MKSALYKITYWDNPVYMKPGMSEGEWARHVKYIKRANILSFLRCLPCLMFDHCEIEIINISRKEDKGK